MGGLKGRAGILRDDDLRHGSGFPLVKELYGKLYVLPKRSQEPVTGLLQDTAQRRRFDSTGLCVDSGKPLG